MADIAVPVTLPDRFEGLSRRASDDQVASLVLPVDDALSVIDTLYAQMHGSGRGAFLALRGDSGAGKSTFLHTVGVFREGVKTISVGGGEDIRGFFNGAHDQGELTIYVLEEREAAVSFTNAELETWLHAINGFIRSENGHKSIVVWPCNTDELLERVKSLAKAIGGKSLLSLPEEHATFNGPPKTDYPKIAENTLAILNQGATFADLGLSTDRASQLVEDADTIGSFLANIRDEIQINEVQVQKLVAQEQCRLWVIVAAGSEPSQEIAALTRGKFAATDIERLMSATEANIVQELKKYPEKLGILATILDAKILHLPVTTALYIIRAFSDDALKARMRLANLGLTPNKEADALERLSQTEVARMFRSESQTVSSKRGYLGSKSRDAFEKLADLAASSDIALNRALGDALKNARLVESFETERDFGKGLTRRTDLLCQSPIGPVRLEVMWRKRTSRAEIANYTLGKIYNYGKALGYLE